MDWVQLAGLAGAVAAALIALLEYRSAVRWRRADSLAQLMKGWREHPLNRTSMALLDVLATERGESTRVDFGDASAKWEVARFQEIDADLVLDALWTKHDRAQALAMPAQRFAVCSLIREMFDYFFSDLSHIERYMRSGLYKSNEMRQYLKWYVGIPEGSLSPIGGTRERFEVYFQEYGFDDILALIARARRERWLRAD